MTQEDFIKTALRLPPDLHAEVHASAARHERTFNGEIIFRLKVAMALERKLASHAEAESWYAVLREVTERDGIPITEGAARRLSDPKMQESVRTLGLSLRVENCLISEGLFTIGDVMRHTSVQLQRGVPNIGKGSVREIEAALKERGLRLPKLGEVTA